VKRAEGKSTRVIAEELGVPQKTVARDSTESVDSPENVTGKDGKKRPANKVPAFPFKGLGMTLEDLKVIAQGSIEALDAIDRATMRGRGAQPGNSNAASVDKTNGNIVPIRQPKGNSARRALRKLRTEGERGNDQAADLHRQLLAGQVSANAAMIQAGFRKRSKSYTGEPLERARKAFQDLTEEERRAFLKGA